MRSRTGTAALTCGLVLVAAGLAPAQQPGDQPPEKSPRQKQLEASIRWQKGPAVGKLGSVATVRVPAGYRFTEGDGARAQMELNGNPPNRLMLGLLEPVTTDGKPSDWLVTFSYEDSGYVKDDEKDKIDADAILKDIKEGTVEANKERAKMGSPALDIVGWDVPPAYNATTNRLSWAIRGKTQGGFIVNYNTKLLGRGGVMSANLIVDPEDLSKTLPTFEQLLTGYGYNSGQTYAEFQKGDKVAEYGLAALIGGGALAVAAKTGLLGKLLKPIIVGVAIIGGLFVKFYKKIFGRGE